MHCMRGNSHPPYPPLRKGGKVGGVWSFSPLAKGGYRGVLRVPLRCARFGIQAIENRSRADTQRIEGCQLGSGRPVRQKSNL